MGEVTRQIALMLCVTAVFIVILVLADRQDERFAQIRIACTEAGGTVVHNWIGYARNWNFDCVSTTTQKGE